MGKLGVYKLFSSVLLAEVREEVDISVTGFMLG
jgi:hypothetical protein